MKDDFMYVLENYPNADLSKKEDRELISESLLNFMYENHIVTYTDLDAVKNDKNMLNRINENKKVKQESIMERGL